MSSTGGRTGNCRTSAGSRLLGRRRGLFVGRAGRLNVRLLSRIRHAVKTSNRASRSARPARLTAGLSRFCRVLSAARRRRGSFSRARRCPTLFSSAQGRGTAATKITSGGSRPVGRYRQSHFLIFMRAGATCGPRPSPSISATSCSGAVAACR